MIDIKPFQPHQTEAVIKLILHIQQNEFGVPITRVDQPDLLSIPDFYQKNGGQFWVATILENEFECVIGTAALIDCGEQIGCIRKMFVRSDFRGKAFGLGQKLLDLLLDHAREKGFATVLLGTRRQLFGAIRFYIKNEFEEVLPQYLPLSFPRMAVDDCFFKKEIGTLDSPFL